MKVVCINSYFGEIAEDYSILTEGKAYDATLDYSGRHYILMNDSGSVCGYFVHRFITLKEYRKRKLEKLNNI